MKDALGSVQSILVLGGSSEIGVAIAQRLTGPRHATVVLAGRDEGALEKAAQEVRTAGAGRVEVTRFDAREVTSHDEVIANAVELAGGELDVIVVAFGLLGDQEVDEIGGDGAVDVATTNYVGAVASGLAAARLVRRQGHGTIVFLSSVAGERVRRANFIYGSSKAGMDGFAQGLGDALAGSGGSVLVVRPGFVRTKMTEGMREAPLSTTAEAVADATAKAVAAGKEVIWVPATLRFVFMVFRHLPRIVWRRMPA
ncbi:MAG TPA: decaprenylphospho-beta-D-erythro-pentofuranosid-2-ulose 2-reductase [Acidimicrobiales bacterium]|nr:decaprenylphospho-beta-D-erythro-pentofuranosid-2-ulose 2-reductase [Acidimicrobiales bacterium]